MHKLETNTPFAVELLPEFEGLSLFDPQWRTDLAWVCVDQAKAASFFKPVKNGNDVILYSIKRDLTKVGLNADIYEIRRSNFLIYARTSRYIEELAHILDATTPNPTKYGQICGFPQTAIAAYCCNKVIRDDRRMPLIIRRHPLYRLLNFQLSYDHCHQEWTWFVQIMEKIKREKPKLIHFLNLNHFYS